jgi:hypothetical protein
MKKFTELTFPRCAWKVYSNRKVLLHMPIFGTVYVQIHTKILRIFADQDLHISLQYCLRLRIQFFVVYGQFSDTFTKLPIISSEDGWRLVPPSPLLGPFLSSRKNQTVEGKLSRARGYGK